MKMFYSRNLITLTLLALAFVIGPFLRAQTPEPAATEQPPVAPVTVAKTEPAKPEAAEKTAVAPEVPANVATNAVAVEAAPPAAEEKKVEAAEPAKTESPANAEQKETKPKHGKSHNRGHHSGNERVSVFHDSTLAEDERADAVVSILGSSTAAGDVNDAVVSILGSSTSSGDVGDAVVSVLGNTRITGGSVGDAAVAVLGNTYVNGHVKGTVVAVLGNVELGPDAEVGGEIVCVGGEVKRDPKAIVHGNVQNIALAGHGFDFEWLHTWFAKCLLYARPLAFDARLMWAWWIALGCLGFYALIALIVPQGVNKCVQTLEERPGYSLLSAVLTMLLTPVAYLLLVLTLAIAIGFLLIPLFSFGLFIAAIFGKVVILAWLGRRITKLFGDGPLGHPVFGVLIGGVIVLGLYTVPVVGFITYKLIGLLGLGVVLYTLLRSIKSNRPVAPAPVTPSSATTVVPPLVGGETPVLVAPASTVPPVISASTLPRAGFWLRLGAALLDVILIGLVCKMLFGLGSVFLLCLVIYTIVMWGLKGTTIGGIICGLKVVRIDDRPLDWSVATVRALMAFFSFCVFGLGFIWVAFDDDKQSWHDKIAGTTIVRVPKGTPLL